MTKIHVRLHETLWGLGFDVEDELKVGPYFIDCYVRELHLGFEADGQAYHKGKDAQRDAERDAWILANAGIPIKRVPDYDLKREHDPETVRMLEEFMDEHGFDVEERRAIAARNEDTVGFI